VHKKTKGRLTLHVFQLHLLTQIIELFSPVRKPKSMSGIISFNNHHETAILLPLQTVENILSRIMLGGEDDPYDIVNQIYVPDVLNAFNYNTFSSLKW